MNSDDQLYGEIEDYLNGELTEGARIAFEKKMAENKELQQAVETSKLANELIIEHRLGDVKSILKETHTQAGKGNTGKTILLGLGGLLVCSALLFFLSTEEKLEKKQTKSLPDTSSVFSSPDTLKATNPPEFQEEKPEIAGDTKNDIPETKIPESTPGNPPLKFQPDSVPAGFNKLVKPEENAIDSLQPVQHPLPDKDKPQPTPTNSKAETPPVQHKNINPCEQQEIHARVSAIASCRGEKTGSVRITDIRDGYAPYSVQLKDADNNILMSRNNLGSGDYFIEIKDNNGCTKEISLNVPEKPCPKDYDFNPYMGEVWNIPISERSGDLIIYDKTGQIYLQKRLTGGVSESWDGHSRNGELRTGYFIFTIRYDDGSSINGSVTIVR